MALKQHIADLKAQGFKPKLSRTNDACVVRVREAGKPKQTLTASSEQEAIDIKQRVPADRWASGVSAGPASSWWASSVFISRPYCCKRNPHRPSQRWTSNWPAGLGWPAITSVCHGGSA